MATRGAWLQKSPSSHVFSSRPSSASQRSCFFGASQREWNAYSTCRLSALSAAMDLVNRIGCPHIPFLAGSLIPVPSAQPNMACPTTSCRWTLRLRSPSEEVDTLKSSPRMPARADTIFSHEAQLPEHQPFLLLAHSLSGTHRPIHSACGDIANTFVVIPAILIP